MKVILCFVVLLGVASCGRLQYYQEPVINLNEISHMSPYELDLLAGGLAAEELIRTKRSGSGDVLGTVAKSISSGIGSKIGFISQASAGASSFLSGGSKGHDEHQGYEYSAPSGHGSKAVDFFSLKKSILNTLFQALKAITGGVTILKGQLIKGGGALASGLGKVVSVKGEAITNLGRSIVNSASLSPPKKHAHISVPVQTHSHSIAIPSGPAHSSYSAPSAPSHHEIPSAPAYSYEPPQNAIYGPPAKYSSHLEGSGKYTPGVQAGVIILKSVEPTLNLGTSYGAPSGPSSNAVHNALSAVNGLFKYPTDSHSSHASSSSSVSVSGPSGPSQYTDSLYHPPPPLPSSHNSFNSYSDSIPPFKPLDIPTGSEVNKLPSTSYGVPFNNNLQAMVDSLLGVHTLTGPSVDSYAPYAPGYADSKKSYSSKSVTYVKKPSGLNPVKLSKVTDNLDKIKLDRSDMGRSLSENPSLYEQMAQAKKILEESNQDDPEATDAEESEARAFNDEEDADTVADEDVAASPDTSNVMYELRGNRIVRVADKTADV